jgi:ethanolamine utilization protein EutN
MIVGTVIGTVWATKKHPSLEGLRFLLVQPNGTSTGNGGSGKGKSAAVGDSPIVAADTVGAGIGETVLVETGRAARNAIGRGDDVAVQTAVVGIVDEVQRDA